MPKDESEMRVYILMHAFSLVMYRITSDEGGEL